MGHYGTFRRVLYLKLETRRLARVSEAAGTPEYTHIHTKLNFTLKDYEDAEETVRRMAQNAHLQQRKKIDILKCS